MRTRLAIFLPMSALAVALSLMLPAETLTSPTTLLVKWREGPTSAAAAEGNAHIGTTVKRNFNAVGWQLVELPAGLGEADGLKAFQALAAVVMVEPNRTIHLTRPPMREPNPWPDQEVSDECSLHLGKPTLAGVTPDDPLFRQQWNLKKIGAPEAWATTTGTSNIVVAVLDTGVDYLHPDLAANLWHNPGETGLDASGRDKAGNGVDDDENGYVDDVYGGNVVQANGEVMDTGFYFPPDSTASAPVYHGTMIAGIIAAVGGNAIGVAGINHKAQLMVVSLGGGDGTDLHGESDIPYYSNEIAGLDYVLTMKRRGVNVRVMNLSNASLKFGAALEDAVNALGQEDILCVFAAGNYSADLDSYSAFPACFNGPAILSVAASTSTDALASFSCYGQGTVDLAAPGDSLTSTVRGGTYQSGLWGTSLASPHVAGAAALLLSARPDLTVDQLKASLFGSVDQPAAIQGKVLTHGRLNVGRALEYLTLENPPAIVITALPAGQRTPTDFPIQVTFNRPMNRGSVEAAFGVQPPLRGVFEWAADGRSFSFRHDAPFDTTSDYTVRILGTAQDEAGGTLDGNFSRSREGSPADDFVWTFRFPIPNDDFVNARWLAGEAGQVDGDNRYANWDEYEPQPLERGAVIRGNTLWYRWTAPEGGWLTADLTAGATFDTVLDIYTGAHIEQLVPIASNDNDGNRMGSRVSFGVAAGTEYLIRVSGKNGFDLRQSGPFKLSWYRTPPPGFTGAQFSPRTGMPGTKVTLTGTNLTGATAVLFNGASASFTNALTNNLDLRITATVPPDAASGPITVITPHGSVTSTATFQVLPPPLSIARLDEGRVEVRWPAASDAMVLETIDDLAGADWSPVLEVPRTANGESVLLLSPAGRRFYRLRAE